MPSKITEISQIESVVPTRVAGVSSCNADGSSRQKIISSCHAGDRVFVQREPDNPNLTFALRRVLPARPNYIWFVCNTYHAKKARNSLSEDLPSFLSSRFLACCCLPCFCAEIGRAHV